MHRFCYKIYASLGYMVRRVLGQFCKPMAAPDASTRADGQERGFNGESRFARFAKIHLFPSHSTELNQIAAESWFSPYFTR